MCGQGIANSLRALVAFNVDPREPTVQLFIDALCRRCVKTLPVPLNPPRISQPFLASLLYVSHHAAHNRHLYPQSATTTAVISIFSAL